MKIFAIYLRLVLTSKPDWFDDIRNKYSSTSILHITLIQPRYVKENEIQDLKDRVSSVLSKGEFNDKKLIFTNTELWWDEKDSEYLLMSFIKENKSVLNLQGNLMEALKDFNNYCDESMKEYELNFKPHLTIANRISLDAKEEIAKLISENFVLDGSITDLVLPIVKDRSVEESEDPNNWIVFDI